MKHFSAEFKQKVIDDYNAGTYGGRDKLAKHYGISRSTIWHWIVKDRTQRYEILKKYQAFLKIQRER